MTDLDINPSKSSIWRLSDFMLNDKNKKNQNNNIPSSLQPQIPQNILVPVAANKDNQTPSNPPALSHIPPLSKTNIPSNTNSLNTTSKKQQNKNKNNNNNNEYSDSPEMEMSPPPSANILVPKFPPPQSPKPPQKVVKIIDSDDDADTKMREQTHPRSPRKARPKTIIKKPPRSRSRSRSNKNTKSSNKSSYKDRSRRNQKTTEP